MRRFLRREILGGVLLIALVSGITWWVVERYTKPGHMSLLEAQGMDMSAMRAPLGTQPVAAETVAYGSMEGTVTYTGTAVAFTDEDVYPRVVGRIVSLPVYAGDTVRPGQLIVRLDSEELRAREAEAAAGKSAASAGLEAATAELTQARAMLSQAEAELGKTTAEAKEAKEGAAAATATLEQARQETRAASEEEAATRAESSAAQAEEAQARAEVSAMQAEVDYWTAELKREQALLDQGAVSLDEFQREKAQAEAATARLANAQALLSQRQAAIRASEKRVAQAEAAVEQAKAKVSEMEAGQRGAAARIERAESAVQSAKAQAEAASLAVRATQARKAQAQAMMGSAGAALTASKTIRGYTEVRASVHGVVAERTVSPGVLVSPGMRILRVAQIDPIRVQANVAEKDAARIKVGAPVSVRSIKNPASPKKGKVTAVFPAADPQSRTSIIEAVITNHDHQLLPGDYVTVAITYGKNEHALSVPRAALVTVPEESAGPFTERVRQAVWTVVGTTEKVEYTCPMHPEVISDQPGNCPKCGMRLVPKSHTQGQVAHLVEVTVGLQSEDRAEITTGLEPGDRVIYAGHQDLKEGDPVFVTAWGKEGPLELPSPPAGAGAMPGMEHGTTGGGAERPGMSHQAPATEGRPSEGRHDMGEMNQSGHRQ